jgi:hypothetical protein
MNPLPKWESLAPEAQWLFMPPLYDPSQFFLWPQVYFLMPSDSL